MNFVDTDIWGVEQDIGVVTEYSTLTPFTNKAEIAGKVVARMEGLLSTIILEN